MLFEEFGIFAFLLASIPAIGFGMLFNVPKNALVYCGFGGVITFSIQKILIQTGIAIELSTFVASLTIAILTELYIRKNKMPRSVYTVAAIIPLIPAGYAITAMISLVDMHTHGVSLELIFRFLDTSMKALSILGAISFGLALPSLYFTRYNRTII
ncbi:MAG: threonine/serine exporter family protein [Halarcobacter sp.]